VTAESSHKLTVDIQDNDRRKIVAAICSTRSLLSPAPPKSLFCFQQRLADVAENTRRRKIIGKLLMVNFYYIEKLLKRVYILMLFDKQQTDELGS